MREHKKIGTRVRGTAAAICALGALAALGVLAGASWSATSSSATEYQYGSKVTICHHTHSKKHPWVTITVGQAAVKAHLKHGDTVGPCPSASPKTASTSTPATTKSHGHGDGNGSGHGQGKGKGK
jgi:ABC-type sugar transport system substrate-binding protein